MSIASACFSIPAASMPKYPSSSGRVPAVPKVVIPSRLQLSMAMPLSAMYSSTALPALAADSDAENTVAVTEAAEDNAAGAKAIAAAVAVGVVAAAAAVGMAIAIAKSVESMARQPEAAGKINSAMMLGLVFIETAIIYALVVAILVIFVL